MSQSPGDDIVASAAQLHREGRYGEAVTLLEPFVDTDSGTPGLLAVYASSLRYQGRREQALAVYERLEHLSGDSTDFWFNRANLLADLGRHEQADTCLGRALEITPGNAAFLANRGRCRGRLGDLAGAEAFYRAALAVEPDHLLAAHNLANLLAERGEVEEATTLFNRVLHLSPELAEAHYNFGRLLLRRGDFARGTEEYEWRWRVPGFSDRPDYGDLPVWDGRPFAGKCLVVHAEQGLGDTIQFSRLLGLAKSLGGDVVLHVPEKLADLLSSLLFDVEVVHRRRRPAADLQIPLMSLPHGLKLTPGSLPRMASHLSAEDARAQRWSERLSLGPDRNTIGVVWQGNPSSPVEQGRSLSSPEILEPLSRLDGVRLIALQKLESKDIEPAPLPSGWRVRGLGFDLEHPGPDFDSGSAAFLDTAAIMSRLDLVVSVCTAPLHLAGALGRPAIALLKSVPDWRWGMRGDRTQWYPAMRLERQLPGEDFGPAIGRAAVRAMAMLSRAR
jgi:Tfp pilus assembly protein PilF